MTDFSSKPATAFEGQRMLLSGPLINVAIAVKAAISGGSQDAILVFDDMTGRIVDLDLRGSDAEIMERLTQPARTTVGRYRPIEPPHPLEEPAEQRGRGRPKLGVVSREVTLLPRQWEWLATQPGGTSAVLRKLVDAAKRNGGSHQKQRAAQEAAYQFMLAIAGDLPGYEEATRALFANDRAKLEEEIKDWPGDIRTYVLRLASGAPDSVA